MARRPGGAGRGAEWRRARTPFWDRRAPIRLIPIRRRRVGTGDGEATAGVPPRPDLDGRVTCAPNRGGEGRAMPHKVFHGFAWYAYPDVFGLDDGVSTDPGHPFASPSGEARVPDEVLYYRPAQAGRRRAPERAPGPRVPRPVEGPVPPQARQRLGVRARRADRRLQDRGREGPGVADRPDPPPPLGGPDRVRTDGPRPSVTRGAARAPARSS